MSPILQLEIFSLISILFVALMLFITHKYVKEDKRKFCYLASAFLCLFTHYSLILYQLITGTVSDIPSNLYLPEWPCNVMMWLIVVVSVLLFLKNNVVTKYLLYITSWVGSLCAIFGLCINFNFLDTPDLTNYGILKGLLSHVFLLYCSVYPFVEGKVKYNFFRITFALLISGALFVLCGNYSRLIHQIRGEGNGVTMINSPFDALPWFNLYILFPMIIALWIIVSTIYEIIRYKKENRWFNKLKNTINELKGE